MTTIGYQGEPGAFSEEAALTLLDGCDARGYADFESLLEAVNTAQVEFALLPCENSIYGSIARSYDLLLQFRSLHIVDETSHGIVQCLIGTNDCTLDSIASVASHPVALEQCRSFLANYPTWRIEAAGDTAGSVRAVAARRDRTRAAIGPALAAQRYDAKVLVEHVADERENITRFFLVSRSATPRRNLGRACLAFHLPHRAGSLHTALAGFARRGLNLRNLVVRPRRGRPFEYTFYAELEVDVSLDNSVLTSDLTPESRLLGRY